MFVLLTGQVHLCKLGPQGQESILAVIEPVIMFNEVAVLDGGPNPATAIAIQDCITWNVSCTAFRDLMRRYPQVGLGLLPVLAARNRFLISQYEDLSFRSVLARTAKLLLDLSQYGRQTIQRREHTIYEMAARIATVPEAVSRSLKTFKKDGCIVSTRASITVRQPEALARAAQIGPQLFID
jgi:CRP/FNR family transcriptional regulator